MKTVYGIITILEKSENPRVFRTWTDLVKSCQLPGELLSPVPHFTWHVAESYQHPEVIRILEDFSRKRKPFRVQATGLGLFTGSSPTLYVPILKKIRLIRIHRKLSQQVTPFSEGAFEYYMPDQWVPHVTIASGVDLPHHLACALEQLVYREIRIDITVDHLALGHFTLGGAWGIDNTFHFGRKEDVLGVQDSFQKEQEA